MMWYDLGPEKNQYGKYTYLDAEVILTEISPSGQMGQYGSFQPVKIQNRDGVSSSPASVFHSAKAEPREIGPQDLNKPLQARVKVEPDSSKFAVNGMKYTIMFSKPARGSSGASSGKSAGSYRPEDPKVARGKTKCAVTTAFIQSGKTFTRGDIVRWVDFIMGDE